MKADGCHQVSVRLHGVFAGFFCPYYGLCSVCILPQPAFYSLQSALYTQSAFTLGPQSAVCVLH